MDITEKDARGMYCPMTRRHCAGQKCMAWRWVSAPERREIIVPDTSRQRPAHVPRGWMYTPSDEINDLPAVWAEPIEEANSRRLGRCGLVPHHTATTET